MLRKFMWVTGLFGVDSAGLGKANSEGRSEHVRLEIYNIRGQKIRTLVDGYLEVGRYSVVWNGDDMNGRSVSSGIYFYRLETSTGNETRKMLLMK